MKKLSQSADTTIFTPILPIIFFCCFLFNHASFADEASKFYIEGLIGSDLKNLDASSDYAGAPGYLCADCSTGKIGNTDTSGDITLGLKFGYKYSDSVRFDISYYSLGYGKTTWGTDFASFDGTYNPAFAFPFTGKLTSKTVFFSTYYNLNLSTGFKPYIGAGIGPSWNKFHNASESNYAEVDSNDNFDIAYKFDIGVMYQVYKNMDIDFGVSFIDVGDFQSAKNRKIIASGADESIAPYKFSSELSPIVNLGIIYNF